MRNGHRRVDEGEVWDGQMSWLPVLVTPIAAISHIGAVGLCFHLPSLFISTFKHSLQKST